MLNKSFADLQREMNILAGLKAGNEARVRVDTNAEGQSTEKGEECRK